MSEKDLYLDGERIFSKEVHDTAIDIRDSIMLRTPEAQFRAWLALNIEGVQAVETEYKRTYGTYPQEDYGESAMDFCSSVHTALEMLALGQIGDGAPSDQHADFVARFMQQHAEREQQRQRQQQAFMLQIERSYAEALQAAKEMQREAERQHQREEQAKQHEDSMPRLPGF